MKMKHHSHFINYVRKTRLNIQLLAQFLKPYYLVFISNFTLWF